MSGPAPAQTVDALGLLCPLPVLRLEQAARRLEPGVVLAVLSDDPGILEDLPAWCEGRGHALLALEPLPGPQARARWRGLVRLGGGA